MQIESQQEPQPTLFSTASLTQEPIAAQEETGALSVAERTDAKAGARAVIDHLHQSVQRRKKARLGMSLFLFASGMAAATCGYLLMKPYLVVFSVVFSLLTIIMNVFILPFLARRQEARSRNVLETLDDVSMVGPLLQAYAAEQSTSQPHISAALRRLLPRLQDGDANLLNREQRTALYQVIGTHRMNTSLYDKSLSLAGLRALRYVGDKNALPVVLKLAKSADREVRDAANDCLQPLLELAEHYKRGEQYLRPSSASTIQTDQAEVLLRPVSGVEQTAPEQLLRASKEE